MIRKIKVEEAVGMTLAHDVTKIVPSSFKGPAFRRGYVIQKDDIPEFLRIGKEHIYVLTLEKGEIHEDEAAIRIAQAVKGPNLIPSTPSEGRVNLISNTAGVVKINETAVEKINLLGEMIVVTLHNNTVCKKETVVAGMRIIPLYINEDDLMKMEYLAAEYHHVISVSPFKFKKIGLIVTGSEVFSGRIKDEFTPVIKMKVEALGCKIQDRALVPDDADQIAQTILKMEAAGNEIILCSSGMSVDPDDATPEGIRRSGADIRFYGLPVLPGAMFLYAKLRNTHVIGVPACALHAPTTAFDSLFPVVLTGEELTFTATRKLGHGGLCLKCEICRYPVCPFCK